MEEWREIREYPKYSVSNEGRVRNFKTGRILKQGTHKQGYHLVWLSDENGRHGKSVHRLVAEAFIPNPNGKPQVNHIDGNKANNGVKNLEWNTGSENTKHAYKTGLLMGRPKSPVRIIETGEIFGSIRECASKLNGSQGDIWKCLAGKQKSHCGLHFERVQRKAD